MGSKEIIDKFKDRANRFLKSAEFNLNLKWYDFAVFNAEQALQLALKAIILENAGNYPFTHDLRELISLASKYIPDLKTLMAKYSLEIDFLIHAYIESRYMSESYSEEVAKHLVEVVKEFLKVMRILTE